MIKYWLFQCPKGTAIFTLIISINRAKIFVIYELTKNKKSKSKNYVRMQSRDSLLKLSQDLSKGYLDPVLLREEFCWKHHEP